MITKKFKTGLCILALLVIISYLLPIVKIGSTTSVKPDYFLLMVINGILFLSIQQIKEVKLFRRYFLIVFLISFITIFSNYFAGFYYLKGENYRLPLTFILILNRISTFVFFAFLIFEKLISYKKVIRLVSIVFILAGIFGACQFLDLFGAKDFALRYFVDEMGVQGQVFIISNRITGVSPAVITWGGCSVLMFYFFYFLEPFKMLKIVGIFFSVFNVIGSASRAAIFSLLASLIIIMIVKVLIVDKKFISLFKAIGILLSLLVGGFLLLKAYLPDQVEFLEKRIEQSEDAMTVSGRGEQLDYFNNLLAEDWFGYLFGIGDSVIVEYGYLEVDYAYIFVAFGLFGFFLHYSLILLLVLEAYKFRKIYPNGFLFVIASTVGYLIFSFGFYFFYELYMGLPFWWLNGTVIGLGWLMLRNNGEVT